MNQIDGLLAGSASRALVRYVEPADSKTRLLSKTDPKKLAALVAEGMHAGVASVVDSCVILVEALKSFNGDTKLISQFTAALAEQNVIPRRSARIGEFNKSKLAMLRKIGENRDLLMELLKYLQPGYSVLYHVVLLYEALRGNHHQRLASLINKFSEEGHLSREFLIKEIKKAEQPAHPSETEEVTLPALDGPAYDLVLLDLRDRGYRRHWSQDQADKVPLYGRVYQNVADQAVAVCAARLSDLPILEGKLLPGCGFGKLSRIYLARTPANADVTEAEVVVIAVKGSALRALLDEFDWLPPDEILDPVAIAERLVPDATSRLYLFASGKADGWHCVVGDANWTFTDE